MKKIYKFIIRSLALLATVTAISTNQALGQLTVSILHNEVVQDPVSGCLGLNTILESEVTGGSGDYIYTWSSNPAIAQFMPLDEVAFFSSTAPEGTYTVTLDVEDNISGHTGSSAITVTINPRPLSTIAANGPTTFCTGGSVELRETNTQSGVSFQWMRNGVDIPGQTADRLNATLPGSYRVRVTYLASGCFRNSNAISVTVHPLPSPNPTSNSPVCHSSDITLGSAAGMTSYSWTFNSGVIATTQSHTIPNATPANSGTYTITVQDANGCVNSASVNVLVHDALLGGVIAAAQSICHGATPSPLTSTSAASGGSGAFTYQWQSSPDGATWSNIPGETSLGYAPAALTATTHYRRVATTGCGTVNSNTIIVTVHAALNGGSIAADQAICFSGDPANLTSVAPPSGGTGGWTFAWESRVGAGAWAIITGATSPTYDPPAGLTATTEYRRVATNACGVVLSNTVTVTVHSALSGGTIAADQSICFSGDPAHLTSATAPSGGTGAWTFAWQTQVGAGAWTTIPGATANTYDPPAGLTVTTRYRRVATNACGSTPSNEITITVLPDIAGGAIAAAQSICHGATPSPLTSTAPASGGSGAFTYQWQSSPDGTLWTPIAGATALGFAPPALTATTHYRRVATTGCGTVNSNTIIVTVHAPVLGGTIGTSHTKCINQAPDPFTSVALPTGGSGIWIYQWQISPDGVAWTDIPGATSVAYTHPTPLTVTTHFRRMARNTCGPAAPSNPVIVTINPLPDPPTAVNNSVCFNGAAHSATATPPAGASVVWYTAASGGSVTTAPTGTAVGTYTAWAESLLGTGCVSSTRTQVTLTINPLPTPFAVTGGGNYCQGDAGLPVGLSGSQSNTTYTLFLGGTPTATTLAGNGAALSFGLQTAGTYTVQAQNDITGCQSMMTGSAVITEIPSVGNNSILSDQTICSGSIPAQLTGPTPTGGTGAYTYQWHRSTDGSVFTPIAGATGLNFLPPALTQSTWYRRVVSSGPCSHTSNTILVTVNPPITNNTIGSAQSICYNAMPSNLTGSLPTGGSGVYTYLWESSTDNITFNAAAGLNTGQNYQPTALTQTTWFRRVVLSAPCPNSVSSSVQITVSPEFTITGFTQVSPRCSDSPDGEAEVNHMGGTTPITYSWLPSGQTTKRAVGLTAGVNYAVTVTDALGCNAAGANTITLTAPPPITIASLTVTSISDMGGCHGDAVGTIQVLAAGGTPGYTYNLYNGVILVATLSPVHPTPALFTGLVASSNYHISVTDANGCTPAEQSGIVLAEPDPLVVSDVDITDALCYGEVNGNISITATGGVAPYRYSIDGDFGPWVLTNSFTLGKGEYEVWVRDANGCTAEWGTVLVDEPAEILVSVAVHHITTCSGDQTGRIVIEPFPGDFDEYEYSIHEFPTPAQWVSNHVFTNLPGGQYYPKARHRVTGCEAAYIGSTIVQQPTQINFDVEILAHVTGCWYNTNGRLRVQNVTGGAPGAKQVSINMVDWFLTTRIFTGIGKGPITVYVRDMRGCISQKTVVILGPDPIQIVSSSITNVNCFGNTNGVIQVNATGGTGSLTYFLDGGSSNSSGLFTGLAPGNYLIEIYDANWCMIDTTLTVVSPPQLVLTTQVSSTTCSDSGNDGSIRARGAGGTPPYTITMFKGGVQQHQHLLVAGNAWVEFSNLAGGNDYHVEIEDSNGCPKEVSPMLEVLIPLPLSINLPIITNATCNASADGSVSISANGGTPPYTFTLYSSSNAIINTLIHNSAADFTGLSAGIGYYITLDDANGCGVLTTAPFNITDPTPISYDTNVSAITCFGTPVTVTVINVTGGAGGYEYSFNGGAFGSSNVFSFTPITAGVNVDVTVVVRDVTGCELPRVITIAIPNQLGITLAINQQPLCIGQNSGIIFATSSGGTPPILFQLNGAGAWTSSGTFSNLLAGNHTVQVMDGNGCTNQASVTLVNPSPIVITSVTPTNPTCSAPGSITAVASGGTGTLVYTLSPGAITNTTGVFGGLGTGNYQVSVTDANSCPPTTSAIIPMVAPLPININAVNVTDALGCFVDNPSNGTIEIVATGGNGPFQYSIDGGLTFTVGNTFTGLAPSNYNIVVTDNVCPASTLATVAGPAEITYTIVTQDPESPFGAANGAIQVLGAGGTGVLSYELRSSSGMHLINNTGNFIGLSNRIYWVVITDELGCSVTTSNIELTSINITIATTNVTCNGAANGTIAITIAGGTPPYTIRWSNTIGPLPLFNDSLTITDLIPGDYTVTVDDAGPLFETYTRTITQPDALIAAASVTSPSCYNGTDGGIVLSPTGGTVPYTMVLTRNGQPMVESALGIYNNLGEGVYELVLTDNNGCQYTSTYTLVNPTPINYTLSYIYTRTDAIAGDSIVVKGLPSSSSFQYDLLIEDETDLGNYQASVTNNTGVFTNLTELMHENPTWFYLVRITDQNSMCITETMRFQKYEPQPIACHGDSTGWIKADLFGGLPPYRINLFWIDSMQSIPQGIGTHEDHAKLYAGRYRVSISDSNNDTITQTVNVTQPNPFDVKHIASINPVCHEDTVGTVVLSIAGGTPFISGAQSSYWVNWEADTVWVSVIDSITNVSVGPNTFVIRDANGCTFTLDSIITLERPAPIQLTSLIPYDAICYGTNTGMLTMLAQSQAMPIAYNLSSTGYNETNTNGIFDKLAAGVYTMSITDANGCNFAFPEGDRVSIKQPDSLRIVTIEHQLDTLFRCPYDLMRIVNIQVEGGVPNYSYQWSNGQQELNLVDVNPGTYSLQVRDNNGCLAQKTLVIRGPDQVVIDRTITYARCDTSVGAEVGAVLINGITGGTGPFTSNWFNLMDRSMESFRSGMHSLASIPSDWYRLELTDAAGCEYVFNYHVPFDSANIYSINVSTPTICFGDTILLEPTLSGVYSPGTFPVSQYKWYRQIEPGIEGDQVDAKNTGNHTYVEVGTESTLSVSPLVSTNYRVDIVTNAGCFKSHDFTVSLHNRLLPRMSREHGKNIFFDNNYQTPDMDSTVMTVLADTQYEFDMQFTGDATPLSITLAPSKYFITPFYNWSAPENEVIFDEGVFNTTISFVTGQFSEDQTGRILSPSNREMKYIPVTVLAQSTDMCYDSLSLKVIVLSDIKFPNAFSPNNDGINDRWEVPYGSLFPNMRVRIYNRWGALVWTGTGAEIAPGSGWEGKNSRGRELPIGTYYAVLEYNVTDTEGWKPKVVSVTIIR